MRRLATPTILISTALNPTKKRRTGSRSKRGAKMTTSDYSEPARKSTSAAWFYVPVILILFLGGALSVGAYFYGEPQLTIAESLVAGFGGLAGIIVGLIVSIIGLLIGLAGALIGLVAAGGAVAMTLFIVASPVIAIVLIVLLMRRNKADCPDPNAHQ